MEMLYGDVLSVWRPWAVDVAGGGIESGHHMAEEAPVALGRELVGFLQADR
jgi:haloacetate dehalogenase